MTSPPPGPTGFDLRLAPAALTAWAVTAAGILWGGLAASCVLLGAGATSAAAATWAARRTSTPRVGWPGVLAVLAVGIGFAVAIGLRIDDLGRHPAVARFGTTTTVTVTPTESPRYLRGSRLMFRGRLDAFDGLESSGRVVVFASAAGFDGLIAGRSATFRARIGAPTRPELTVAVLTAAGAPTLGAAPAWQRVAARVRSDLAAGARAVLGSDAAALLPALVLGDTSALGPQTVAEFKSAGLTHLTAVSGANVTIVCGAVLLSAALVGPRVATAAAALALIAFVAVVQPSASVLRAAAMGAVTLFAIASHRRRQAVPALSASVLVLMIIAPELAVDVGFLLSASATAALVVIAPAWSRRLVARRWPKPLADAVAVALAAQAVTAPVIAGISGTFSGISVLANIVVAPVIPPITVLGTAAAALAPLWPAGAGLLIRFTGPELWWLGHVARWGASMPGATAPVPAGIKGVVCVTAAVLAIVVAWRRRWARIGTAVLLLCLLAWASGHGAGTVGAP